MTSPSKAAPDWAEIEALSVRLKHGTFGSTESDLLQGYAAALRAAYERGRVEGGSLDKAAPSGVDELTAEWIRRKSDTEIAAILVEIERAAYERGKAEGKAESFREGVDDLRQGRIEGLREAIELLEIKPWEESFHTIRARIATLESGKP